MLDINGVVLEKLPFNLDNRVGTLLYEEYPATIIYSDENNMPIIEEWVDSIPFTDRFIVYKSSKASLKNFIDGKITHHELLFKHKDGLVFLIEKQGQKLASIKTISLSQIPDKYFPLDSDCFNIMHGVDTNKVIKFFDLDKITVK